ncbi:MAG: transposon-encoded TnpW family protein [Oscillospiraceae bacterium]|nr:transposon-encoded TnpW family protein [Oscillospiraceae bacterium]
MNQTSKDTTRAPGQNVLQRRIGSTTYHVGIFFREGATETLNDKVVRLLKNDLQNMPENGILEPLQAGWLFIANLK